MKTASKFFLPLLLLAFVHARAQDPMLNLYSPQQADTTALLHSSVSFSAEYNAGSDGLTNSFLNNFYKGGFLDSNFINTQRDKLLPQNRVGAYSSYSMAYTFRPHPGTGKWEYLIAYRDRQSLSGKFNDDAYGIAFKGNRAYVGDTADLGNTHLIQRHWHQVQLEARLFAPDGRCDATFGFSFMNGQQYQEVDVQKAIVYTAADGTALDINAKANYYQSDTASRSGNGSGTCFNFRLNAYIGDSTSPFKSKFTFILQDLGYMRWNGNSLSYSVDKNVHYTGVDASQLIINAGSVTGVPDADSLIGQPKRGELVTFMSVGIGLRYTIFFRNSFTGGIDARGWSYSDGVPLISIFGGWQTLNHKISIGSGATLGGFSRLQVPLQLCYFPCKNFGVMAGAANIIGYISPKNTYGQGAYMNLTFSF